MNPNLRIEHKDLKRFLNRPIWYQCRQDVNDFGWAFIHPDTVNPYRISYCKLIKSVPEARSAYDWAEIDLYRKPTFHGICAQCKHYQRPNCTLKNPKCRYENGYISFEPDKLWKSREYTARTFMRQLELSGYKIRKEEECSKQYQGRLPGLSKP